MPTAVVLDTNVWVSAFLNPHGFPAKLLDAWIGGTFQVVISAPLMEELARALSKPRLMLKYGYSDQPLAAHLATRRITVVTVARFLQHLAESPPELA